MFVSEAIVFPLSPVIRLTLVSLYFALTLPLPFLAKATEAPISPWWLGLAIVLGAIALLAALSEKVILNQEQIEVTYPAWVTRFWRRGWKLSWSEIKDLKLRTTGQGGLVYYFITHQGDQAYLLPMRVAGFNRLLKLVETQTGIDTKDIRPLAQPWMYLILFGLTVLLLLIDCFTIASVLSLGTT